MSEAKNMKIFTVFRCIADQCKDNCCAHNWNIEIDTETYERWQSLTDETDRSYLLNNISRSGDVITFKRTQQGTCIHLDEKNLCRIHDKYGAGFLPQVCHTYPRLHLKGINRVSDSLQMSCPEVTRLLFESDSEALFETGTCAAEETLDPAQFNPLLVEINRIMVAYFEHIPFDTELPVGGYLDDICSVLIFLADHARAENLTPEKLAKRCGASRKMIQKRIDHAIADAHAGKERAGHKEIYMFWSLIHDLYQQRPIPQIDELLHGFERRQDYWALANNLFHFRSWSDLDSLAQQAERQVGRIKDFGKLFHSSLKQLERKIGINRLLLRYLLVKFHVHGFPWRPFKGNYTATFLDCVLPFSVIVHLLVALDSAGITVDSSLLQLVIYKVERRFSHNFSIFELLQKEPIWMNLSAYHRVFLQFVL